MIASKEGHEPPHEWRGLAKGLAQRKFLTSGLLSCLRVGEGQQRYGLEGRWDATLVPTFPCRARTDDTSGIYACTAFTKGHITQA